jgi:hypothetical protein
MWLACCWWHHVSALILLFIQHAYLKVLSDICRCHCSCCHRCPPCRCNAGPNHGPNSFLTIMSYPCPDNWPPTIQQFSNAAVSRNNIPTGSPTSNCARMLGETANKMASGRPTAGAPTGTITTSLSALKWMLQTSTPALRYVTRCSRHKSPPRTIQC